MPENEANIQVVIRVRPRSRREVAENSSVCITAKLKSKELQVRTALTESFGSTKTFAFDNVFGPDSDQELLFQDVAAPIIDEVLEGYNCTLFAYGQTGTGKTFTMEGDLDNPYSAHAGIIPRSLNRIFQLLDASKTDYSVKVSFIELYNEELIDLLSSQDDRRKLRIYEDNSKKGSSSVVVQPLEEFIVKNTADVISILQRGSKKRQVAATDFNEASSRSHCVFLITVHSREEVNGEDLLKIGKLYLVDLAGSENISRSGAENKRAREAGIINQSLLTLGRVINSLVDKSPHVPYRESKLTRLLQDSLGGKTKTCIIATVSPSRSCLEESLSTLDYAFRAKKIRNKPELNQKMTKRVLLKEYSAEIERLKSDLQAAREKNGVFLTQERFDELVQASSGTKERLQELSVQLQSKSEQIDILEGRLCDSRQTCSALEISVGELNVALAEAVKARDDITCKLDRERALKQAYCNREQLVNSVANSLQANSSDMSGDLERLSTKLADQNNALKLDRDAIEQLRASGVTLTKKIEASLFGFSAEVKQWNIKMSTSTRSFKETSMRLLNTLEKDLTSALMQQRQQLELYLNKTIDSDVMQATRDVLEPILSHIKCTFHKPEAQVRLLVDQISGSLQNIADVGDEEHAQRSKELTQALENYAGQVGGQVQLLGTVHEEYCANIERQLKWLEESFTERAKNVQFQHDARASSVESQLQALGQECQSLFSKVVSISKSAFDTEKVAFNEFVSACSNAKADARKDIKSGEQAWEGNLTKAQGSLRDASSEFQSKMHEQFAGFRQVLADVSAKELGAVQDSANNAVAGELELAKTSASTLSQSVSSCVEKLGQELLGLRHDELTSLQSSNSNVEFGPLLASVSTLIESNCSGAESSLSEFCTRHAHDQTAAVSATKELLRTLNGAHVAMKEALFETEALQYSVPQDWPRPQTELEMEEQLSRAEFVSGNISSKIVTVKLPHVPAKRLEPSSSPFFQRGIVGTSEVDRELASPLKKRSKTCGPEISERDFENLCLDGRQQSCDTLDTLVDGLPVEDSENEAPLERDNGVCGDVKVASEKSDILAESQLPRLTRSRAKLQN